jgi:hypothetical protein
MVMQVGLLPAVPVYIVLAYQAYQWSGSPRAKPILIWSTLLLLQFVALLWANMMLEQFALVKYIECYLRPQLKGILRTDVFWTYEPYLVKHRPIRPVWGNYSMAGLGFIVTTVLVAFRIPEFSLWDVVGVVMNLALLLILWNLSSKIGKLQRQWAECDKLLVGQLDQTIQ